jgi:DNA/RNA-binding domain of Phe-tRNA-synthetase-like protein
MNVVIDAALAKRVVLGVLRLEGCTGSRDAGESLFAEIRATCAALALRYTGVPTSEIPGVQESRRLYRSIGIDPTKTRPSSEALLRRAVKEKGLYRVHPLVDLFNLVSLETLLSVGLYDESRIAGDLVTVRLGGEGERFEGIRRGPINVAGRLCVADREGPFGSPTADSQRTSIEGAVDRALAIFFRPRNGDPARMTEALDRSEALAAAHLGARAVSRTIIEGPGGAC